MLKNQLLLITFLFCLFNLNAQKESKIKLELGTGFLLSSSSDNFNVEPKLKVSEDAFMGLRIGLVLNPQKFENRDSLRFDIGEEFDEEFDEEFGNSGTSFVPTFDYLL